MDVVRRYCASFLTIPFNYIDYGELYNGQINNLTKMKYGYWYNVEDDDNFIKRKFEEDNEKIKLKGDWNKIYKNKVEFIYRYDDENMDLENELTEQNRYYKYGDVGCIVNGILHNYIKDLDENSKINIMRIRYEEINNLIIDDEEKAKEKKEALKQEMINIKEDELKNKQQEYKILLEIDDLEKDLKKKNIGKKKEETVKSEIRILNDMLKEIIKKNNELIKQKNMKQMEIKKKIKQIRYDDLYDELHCYNSDLLYKKDTGNGDHEIKGEEERKMKREEDDEIYYSRRWK